MTHQDTIIAIATPAGVGAIGVLRLSGPKAITMCNEVFSKDLTQVPSHTLHFGRIRHQGEVLDEVLVSVFRAPHSYTKEDVIEISAHGSPFILESLVQCFLGIGARLAQPGEFTQRAFLNGGMDLAQAEAVADLIAADSQASRRAALHQLRGGFSKELAELREQLIHFASLIELELDFSEEDVEFADRSDLKSLLGAIVDRLRPLISSFRLGNAIKQGIATVIIGKPNAGKSTLLNALLKEDKAIVSDIAGTTRDALEDEWVLEGVRFRLVDTAGLRSTSDVIEAIGVERTEAWVRKAQLILYVADVSFNSAEDIKNHVLSYTDLGIPLLLVLNKLDAAQGFDYREWEIPSIPRVEISAREGRGLEHLEAMMLDLVGAAQLQDQGALVTNLRHFEQLSQCKQSLDAVLQGLDSGITGDFLAQDIRHALFHLGEITGSISNDDLLKNIFGKFCIGK